MLISRLRFRFLRLSKRLRKTPTAATARAKASMRKKTAKRFPSGTARATTMSRITASATRFPLSLSVLSPIISETIQSTTTLSAIHFQRVLPSRRRTREKPPFIFTISATAITRASGALRTNSRSSSMLTIRAKRSSALSAAIFSRRLLTSAATACWL